MNCKAVEGDIGTVRRKRGEHDINNQVWNSQ